MSTQFWIKWDEKVAGPFTSQQVYEMAQEGTLKPFDPISSDQEKWRPARDVRGLFPPSVLMAAPPPKADTKANKRFKIVFATLVVVVCVGAIAIAFANIMKDHSQVDPELQKRIDEATKKQVAADEKARADREARLDRIFKYAPANAIGVINCGSFWNNARNNLLQNALLSQHVNTKPMLDFLSSKERATVFMLPPAQVDKDSLLPSMPMVAVLQGKPGKDEPSLLAQACKSEKLTETAKGRYSGSFDMVVGPVGQIPEGVTVVATAGTLTDSFLGGLGKASPDKLRKGLSDDGRMDAPVGIALFIDNTDSRINQITGKLYMTGAGTQSRLDVKFRDAAAAKQFREGFFDLHPLLKPLKGYIDIPPHQDARQVSISVKPNPADYKSMGLVPLHYKASTQPAHD